MNRYRSSISFLFRIAVSFFALLAALPANAQDSTAGKWLDEIVVTANKYPVKLSETGKQVTIVSRQQIERSSGKSLAQVLTEQSGIIVNGANSNPGKDKSIFLRGATNDYTLILLDGVPVNDPSGAGGAFDIRLFPIEQIDHIEILKGSQSTLYGSDAIAGVINIITKKGGTRPVNLNGGASYGSYNTFNGNAGVNGSTSAIDYNLNYTYTNTDGISEALDKTDTAHFDKDGFMRNSFQANVTVKAGKHLRLSPYYRYTYFRGGFDADAFTDGNNNYTSLLNNAGAVATLAIPKGTLTANYGYSYARRIYASDYGPSVYKGKFNTGEVYLTRELGSAIKLLAGVNYQTYQLLDTTLDKKNPQTNIFSPYLSFFVHTPEGLSVEIGGRYNHHSTFGTNLTYSFNTAYLIRKGLKAFANISSGFKAPSVTDLFGPVYYGSNPDLKPEKSSNIEGGLQWQAPGARLQLTATGYYRDVNDLIAYVGTRLINIDEQKVSGMEWEAGFTPNERWTIKAAYNLVTGYISQSRNGKDTSYNNLVRRPKNAVTASIGYQATSRLLVSLSAQSIGRRADLYFAPPTYASEQVSLDAYTLVNAYAEYKLAKEKLRLFIDGKNLTNARFTEVYGYQTMGINVTAGFRFNL